MSCTEPIDSISRAEPSNEAAPVAAISAIDAIAFEPREPSEPATAPYATHASTCTAFDRYPCILDPTAASIAAAAAAQDMRTFWQASARRKLR